MTFGFSDGWRNFRKLLSCLLRCLNPLSGQILYHDCVSVTVSRFTSFTQNFVICCYQITKLFCSKYWISSAFSAKRTCNFGSLAYFAISVLRKVSKDTVPCPIPLFLKVPDLIHEKCLQVYPLVLKLLRPLHFQ